MGEIRGSISRRLTSRSIRGAETAASIKRIAASPLPFVPRQQVLHVLRHLPWYLLVRPARVGDWAGLLSNAHHLAFTGLVLVLAAAPRQGALWDWWRRCVVCEYLT